MGTRLPTQLMITGPARMRSRVFSDHWTLEDGNGALLANMRRFPRLRMSQVELADGTRLEMVPHGWGVIRMLHEGEPVAQIDRKSFWGRRWEVHSSAFALNLVSRPAPRSWDFALGAHPIAHLRGSLVSYNRLRVQADLGTPLVAVLLAWQVVCRPWEAGAFPLSPARATAGGPLRAPSRPIQAAGRLATKVREQVDRGLEEWAEADERRRGQAP